MSKCNTIKSGVYKSRAPCHPGWLNFERWLLLAPPQYGTCFVSPFWHMELHPSFLGLFFWSPYYITYHQFKIIMIVGYTYNYYPASRTKRQMKNRNSATLQNICFHSTTVRRLPTDIDYSTQLPTSTKNLGESQQRVLVNTDVKSKCWYAWISHTAPLNNTAPTR